MRYIYKLWTFSMILALLSGCAPAAPAPQESGESAAMERSSSSFPIQSETSASSESVPDEPGTDFTKPRIWSIALKKGYEPNYEESSGLYQIIKPSEEIPYKEIRVKAFGEGKIVFEYCTEKHMFNSGDGYSMGNVVVYDIETETYSTAGDHFNMSTPFSGQGIVMDSGYYCTDYMEDEEGLPCMEKVNLATGEKTIPVTFADGTNYGRAFKADDTHFLIYFDVFISEGLWENALYLYDTETDKVVPLPKEIFQFSALSVWAGKLYSIRTTLGSSFSKKPQEYTITVYNLQSGEMNAFESITGETYVLPGESIDSYVGEGQEMTVHFPLDSASRAYYIVWEKGVPVRILILSCGENKEYTTQLGQNTGTAYFWKENVLFLMEIKTGELRMMDMGCREKYPYKMETWADAEGNLLLVHSTENGVPNVYFIPRQTINRLAVPAVNIDGVVRADESPSEDVDHSQKREWDLNVPGGYEPYAEESTGLYRVLHPAEDIPHESILVKAFGEGKAVLDYWTPPQEENSLYGGTIAVYDLESGKTVTVGDKYPASTPYAGDRIVMKSGLYYTENSLEWSNDSAPRMERVNLETGGRTYPVLLESQFWGGYNLKLDDTHFIICYYFNGGNKPIYVFDTETETGYELPNPFPESHQVERVFVQDGTIYWITSTAGPDGRCVISCDPRTGETTAPEPITEKLYFMPWESVSTYLEDGEKVIFYPYGWLVWGKDGSLRQIDLVYPAAFGIDDHEGKTQMGQKRGTAYFQDRENNLLFLIDTHTGEVRILDMGYREKYPYMEVNADGEGNLLLAAGGPSDSEKNLYFVPWDTVEECAVDADQYIQE